MVRKNIYPDFGFSGNDLAYHFIPSKEIWIDGQVAADETEYSIETEMMERELMMKGKSYDDAYEAAITNNQKKREEMKKIILKHPPVVVPDSATRDKGLIDPNEP